MIHRHRAAALRRRRLQVAAGTVVAIAALALGFYLGQQAAYSGMGVDPQQYAEMQREVEQWQAREQEWLHQAGMVRTRHEVDLAALELVRGELAVHKKDIARLEQELNFYRSLMAPERMARGLRLRALELVAGANAGSVNFRIVAQQEAARHQLLKGTLSLEVYGDQAGEPRNFTLADLSDEYDGESVALRFRYFQAIEGGITLPAGFAPQGVRVVAKVTSPRKIEVREDYPWQVQEAFSNVGQ